MRCISRQASVLIRSLVSSGCDILIILTLLNTLPSRQSQPTNAPPCLKGRFWRIWLFPRSIHASSRDICASNVQSRGSRDATSYSGRWHGPRLGSFPAFRPTSTHLIASLISHLSPSPSPSIAPPLPHTLLPPCRTPPATRTASTTPVSTVCTRTATSTPGGR